MLLFPGFTFRHEESCRARSANASLGAAGAGSRVLSSSCCRGHAATDPAPAALRSHPGAAHSALHIRCCVVHEPCLNCVLLYMDFAASTCNICQKVLGFNYIECFTCILGCKHHWVSPTLLQIICRLVCYWSKREIMHSNELSF